MYVDLFLNYDNPGHKSIEKYQDFCELVTSAISDSYQILGVNKNRKGVVANTDVNTFKDLDLRNIYEAYSLKFLNTSNINTNFIQWDAIKILSRLNVEISDTKDLFQFTNQNNALKSYDIISVTPMNEKMFDHSCSDINVDIISLYLEEKFNFSFKKHLILSAIDKNVFFEVVYSDFIKDTTKRSIFISNVLMLLEVTKGRNVILSSRAATYFDHRSPYDVITIFETIFEMKTDVAKKMISDNCQKVILKSVQRKYYKTVISLEVQENYNDEMIIENEEK